MGNQQLVQKVTVALVSPGDVLPERDRVALVVDELNRERDDLKVMLWRWETDSRSGMHLLGAQGLIDDLMQIPKVDVVLGVFWSRFGTPTMGVGSGTEHELRRAWSAWTERGQPDVMVFFCDRPISASTDADQLARLQAFRKEMPRSQVWWSYTELDEFERAVRSQLGKVIRALVAKRDEAFTDAAPREAGVVEPSAYSSPLDEVFCEPYVDNSKKFRSAMSRCSTLSMLGFSHNRMASTYSADLARIVSEGGRLRVLAIDPAAHAVLEANLRSYLPKAPSAARHQHEAALAILSTIGEAISGTGSFEMRLIDCMPPYTVYVFDEDDADRAAAWVWLTPWRVPSNRRPGFAASARVDPGWFKFYREQVDLMWNAYAPPRDE